MAAQSLGASERAAVACVSSFHRRYARYSTGSVGTAAGTAASTMIVAMSSPKSASRSFWIIWDAGARSLPGENNNPILSLGAVLADLRNRLSIVTSEESGAAAGICVILFN